MDFNLDFTTYDFVVIAVFLFFVARGLWLGFLRQVTGVTALYLGYFMASQYNDRLFPFLRDISDNPKVVFLVTYVVLFFATFMVVMLIGKGLRFVIDITITGWFDRVLGLIVGLAKAAICIVLMHMILGAFVAPENELLRKCVVCPVVNNVTDVCRGIIQDPELREEFKQKLPAISVDEVQKYLQPAEKTPPEKSE